VCRTAFAPDRRLPLWWRSWHQSHGCQYGEPARRDFPKPDVSELFHSSETESTKSRVREWFPQLPRGIQNDSPELITAGRQIRFSLRKTVRVRPARACASDARKPGGKALRHGTMTIVRFVSK
jgi:hypothetical protein